MAIMAGFEHCRGARVVTLDADLQNPPEEIGKLLAAMDRGHDYVGSIRETRRDSLWRHVASRLMNRLPRTNHQNSHDRPGCMLRAYSRDIIKAIVATREVSTYIRRWPTPFAANPTEVVVAHANAPPGNPSIRCTS